MVDVLNSGSSPSVTTAALAVIPAEATSACVLGATLDRLRPLQVGVARLEGFLGGDRLRFNLQTVDSKLQNDPLDFSQDM